MSRPSGVVTLLLALLLILAPAAPLRAQTTTNGTRAVAFDTVVGVQDYFDDDGGGRRN